MDVFHIESSNISSSLVDAVADGDITEVSFDAHSEFNLNFFDTPDDSIQTQGGYSEPPSVESTTSLSSTPPPPPHLTPAAATNIASPIEISSSSSNSSSPIQSSQNAKNTANQQNNVLLQPPILVNIKNGEFFYISNYKKKNSFLWVAGTTGNN